jgi:hypothetical protein
MVKTPTKNSREKLLLGTVICGVLDALLNFDWSIRSPVEELLHRGILRGYQVCRTSLGNYLAVENHRNPVRNLKNLRKLMANY